MLSLTKYRQKLLNRVEKAVKYFDLINDGETIILGISGGKDSLFMADILYHFRRKYNKKFRMIGVHVANGIKPLYEKDKLEAFLSQRDIEFLMVEDLNTKKIIENRLKPFKPCYVCSKERRKHLIYTAKDRGINKIALAHTIDDAVETLFLNILYAREISTMVPKQSLFRDDFFVIRPIILIEEDEIETYMKLAGITKIHEGVCPYADTSRRTTVRNILRELYKKDPQVRKNLKHSLFECKPEYLWKKYREFRKDILG